MLRVAAATLARQAPLVRSAQATRTIYFTRSLLKENAEEARYVGGKHKPVCYAPVCDCTNSRLTRGVLYGPPKVNPAKAIELIDKVAPIMSHKRVVSCDGGGGALGHPKVFINLDSPGPHVCGYCGLRYEQEHHH